MWKTVVREGLGTEQLMCLKAPQEILMHSRAVKQGFAPAVVAVSLPQSCLLISSICCQNDLSVMPADLNSSLSTGWKTQHDPLLNTWPAAHSESYSLSTSFVPSTCFQHARPSLWAWHFLLPCSETLSPVYPPGELHLLQEAFPDTPDPLLCQCSQSTSLPASRFCLMTTHIFFKFSLEENCVSFYHLAKWIGCTNTYIPSFFGFPSHLPHHRALNKLPCATQ